MLCRAGTFRVCLPGKILSGNQMGRSWGVWLHYGVGGCTPFSPASSTHATLRKVEVLTPILQACGHHPQCKTVWISPAKSWILLGADQQPTLDTVRMDKMGLHSRGSCGWTSCISLLTCMSLLLLGGGIFEHLYFRSIDLQNSNAIV